MKYEEFLYLLPYLFSLALSASVFVFTWRHRHVRGARTYSLVVAGQVLTIGGFILELISPDLQIKIFWDKFQWLTDSYLVIPPLLLFASEFSEIRFHRPRLVWGIVIALVGAFTFILLTDSVHHLLYPNPQLSTDTPFSELHYDFTVVVYLYAVVFVYGLNLYGFSLLVRRASQRHNPYRMQFWILLVGLSIPIVLTVFALLNIRITPQRDPMPFGLALGNLIIAWGLFRYGLFNLVPIARERIVENMKDPVIVLDPQNRVVDLNENALSWVGKRSAEVIGHPSREVFAKWPLVSELLENPQEQRKDISIKNKGELLYLDINISPIISPRREVLGRIVVARDVTRMKSLEINYRALSQELEQRVQERTEELRAGAERYRAVVENQTEFIVRWKPDRTRTFVNDAYCRHFGLTYEQAMQTDFLTMVAEEDRPAVLEKIQRLLSGQSDVETEIHRVPRADGSLGWQEWTDHAIRDETGAVIEFQSIGRDITERIEAEEALRKSEERFSTAFRASPTILVISQISNATILEVNDTFEEISGYSRHEAIGKSTFDLNLWVHTEDRERLLRGVSAGGQLRNLEIEFRIKNGSVLTCLLSAELIEIGGERCILATIQDISERKAAEARILRLNRLYATISQINQTIVHARQKETLLRDICQVATEHGQYHMAWIGLLDHDSGRVRPFACAGEENGYLSDITIDISDQVLGSGPTGSCIREGRCMICQDIANDPRMIPWRAAALGHGFRSSAAVPLRERGRVVGALTVYARDIHGFDTEDEGLLEQIGQDVSFALDSILSEDKRQIAERNLVEAYDTTLEGWAKALELRDKETEGHSRRVTETTLIVARAMGFDEESLVHIRRGSILHDIGKMGIPDEILHKRGPLTNEERAIIMKHPITAHDLLRSIPYLEKALEIPYSHHEKWDGSGYPQGLAGEQIPLAARIFAVVDVWDALSSDRPYRPGWSKEDVIQYLCNESEKHFDPRVVDVFLQLLKEGKI